VCAFVTISFFYLMVICPILERPHLGCSVLSLELPRVILEFLGCAFYVLEHSIGRSYRFLIVPKGICIIYIRFNGPV